MTADLAAGTLLVAFLGGFLGSFASTASVRRFALRIGAVDHPGGRRVHRSPTARLGGLGIAFGLAVAVSLLIAITHAAFDGHLLAGLCAAAAVALAVGVVDDLRGLGALPKIAGQSAAALLLWSAGWRVDGLGLPGLGALSTDVWNLPLTVLWVVGVINSLNLIDGLDGLAGGVAFVAALGFACLLAAVADPTWILALAFAGALTGFLWFNLSPALIFMGDSGSHLVGLVLAALGMRLSAVAPAGTFPLVAMLLLAVPLCDMAWAIARRARSALRAGHATPRSARAAMRHIASADGAHVHHRLLIAGWTPRGAVGFLWRIAIAFCAVGVALALSPLVALALAAIVASWLTRVAWRAGRFDLARSHAGTAVGSAVLPLGDVARVLVPQAEALEPEEIAA